MPARLIHNRPLHLRLPIRRVTRGRPGDQLFRDVCQIGLRNGVLNPDNVEAALRQLRQHTGSTFGFTFFAPLQPNAGYRLSGTVQPWHAQPWQTPPAALVSILMTAWRWTPPPGHKLL